VKPGDNLPLPVSSFVGRQVETANLHKLLDQHRLVTLTGLGGSGKTRLALHAAADRLQSYRDGVWLVELASLSDPLLVTTVVAETLDVHEQPGREVLDTLAELVNRSLVLAEADGHAETRYRLLETVRAYAAERLTDEAAIRERHAAFYSALAGSLAAEFWTARSSAAAVRLSSEHDNLRSALRYLIESGRAEDAQALGAALVRFWVVDDHWSEADAWIRQLLALGTSHPTRSIAMLLAGASTVATFRLDLRAAGSFARQALEVADAIEDAEVRAWALFGKAGFERGTGAADHAREHFAEGVAAASAVGNRLLEGLNLTGLGLTQLQLDESVEAERTARAALRVASELGDDRDRGRAELLEVRGNRPVGLPYGPRALYCRTRAQFGGWTRVGGGVCGGLRRACRG
jgi:hypothetical protein